MLGRIKSFFVWVWSLIVGFFSWSYHKLRAINWGRVRSGVRRIDWRPWLIALLLFPLYWVNRKEFMAIAPPITIWGWIIRLFVSLLIVGIVFYLAIKFARMRRGSHPLEWVLAVPTVLLLLYIWGGLSFAPAPQFEDVTLVSPSEVEMQNQEIVSPGPAPAPAPIVPSPAPKPMVAGAELTELDIAVAAQPSEEVAAWALVQIFAEKGETPYPQKLEDLRRASREWTSENPSGFDERQIRDRSLELVREIGVRNIGNDGKLIPYDGQEQRLHEGLVTLRVRRP